jgi:hypothetical protein
MAVAAATAEHAATAVGGAATAVGVAVIVVAEHAATALVDPTAAVAVDSMAVADMAAADAGKLSRLPLPEGPSALGRRTFFVALKMNLAERTTARVHGLSPLA